MRIAYVGNFTQKHCTEVHLASTLESLGHQVHWLQENALTPEALLEWLVEAINGEGLDLFLFTRTWGETVKQTHLTLLKNEGITTASYHLDLYIGLSRKWLHGGKSLEEVLKTDPFWRTDFVFTPDGDPKSAEVFKANGVNHHYIKPGVFKDECELFKPSELVAFTPEGPITKHKYDILFVGGGDYPNSPNGYGHPEWPYRDKLIQWLRGGYGDQFKKVGHPQETVRNNELNQLYADSKIVVGDSVCLNFDHTYYWSDRVYETLGRGGFLIHPYIKGMEEEFKDKEHLVYYEYGNFVQLEHLIAYYLEHDDEREAIRRTGHEFVKNNCTYTERLTQALNIISAAEVMPTLTPAAPIKINLGAGSEPTEGWVNLDWIAGEGIQVVHNLLEFPWPFEDNSADEIKAIDVLEHMPNYTPDNRSNPIAFVEECHRILKVGGKLTIQVPHWGSPNMWIDPSHVRGFDPKSMDYFDPQKELGQWYGYYSKCKFDVTAELSHMPDGSPSNVTFVMTKRGNDGQ